MHAIKSTINATPAITNPFIFFIRPKIIKNIASDISANTITHTNKNKILTAVIINLSP